QTQLGVAGQSARRPLTTPRLSGFRKKKPSMPKNSNVQAPKTKQIPNAKCQYPTPQEIPFVVWDLVIDAWCFWANPTGYRIEKKGGVPNGTPLDLLLMVTYFFSSPFFFKSFSAWPPRFLK